MQFAFFMSESFSLSVATTCVALSSGTIVASSASYVVRARICVINVRTGAVYAFLCLAILCGPNAGTGTTSEVLLR